MAIQDQKLKILGLAFAGSDLAFEVGPSGLIQLALGAVEQVAGMSHAAILSAPWSELVCEEDRDLLASLLTLTPGERRGPLRIGLKHQARDRGPRFASLSVLRLPGNGDGLSCAIRLGTPASDGVVRNAQGLLDRNDFDQSTAAILEDAKRAGQPVRVALVELQGLTTALSSLTAEAALASRRRVAAALRLESHSGLGACEIAEDRFAFLQGSADSSAKVSQRLLSAGIDGVTPVATEVAIDPNQVGQGLKTVKYALGRYIETGAAETAAGFEAMLSRTTRETARFKSTLAAGAFTIVYQPIIDLSRDVPHHFEALARFNGANGPADTIQLAEEMGLIVDFDLAIAKAVAKVLGQGGPSLKIAINLSAISLMTDRYVDALLALTRSDGRLRQRMLLEVTETQKLHDLPHANQVLAALRKQGHLVCLDDFGAGAATLDYLSHLEVDFLKIDGRYIQGLEKRPRDTLVVKHLSALCKEMGVLPIAEMVETELVAKTIGELGVPLAQGWLYGKPTAKPIWAPPSASPVSARRMGAVKQWG